MNKYNSTPKIHQFQIRRAQNDETPKGLKFRCQQERGLFYAIETVHEDCKTSHYALNIYKTNSSITLSTSRSNITRVHRRPSNLRYTPPVRLEKTDNVHVRMQQKTNSSSKAITLRRFLSRICCRSSSLSSIESSIEVRWKTVRLLPRLL